jgi:hypothetical protein
MHAIVLGSMFGKLKSESDSGVLTLGLRHARAHLLDRQTTFSPDLQIGNVEELETDRDLASRMIPMFSIRRETRPQKRVLWTTADSLRRGGL